MRKKQYKANKRIIAILAIEHGFKKGNHVIKKQNLHKIS